MAGALAVPAGALLPVVPAGGMMPARSGIWPPADVWTPGRWFVAGPSAIGPGPFPPAAGSFFLRRPTAFLVAPPIACTPEARLRFLACPISAPAIPALE